MDSLNSIQDHFEKLSTLNERERELYFKKLEANPFVVSELKSLLATAEGDVAFPESGLFKPEILIGKKLGSYTIQEELGSGGMAKVFLATQDTPQRQVALKLISFWSTDVISQKRFELEQQSLAKMNHSNIARFFETGVTPEGQPYLVMEYLQGKPVTIYAAQNRLSLRERLSIFCKICQGVTHAHQRGVLHRDIKPGNILVIEEDGSPIPKLIDFGIARTFDESGFTKTGQSPGTWSYMSPEQIDPKWGEQDVRTDIYGLGATLYELLVGVPPMGKPDHKPTPHILREICERTPERPSKTWILQPLADQEQRTKQLRTSKENVTKELKRDLDWIVMKTLEKDPERRYGSVTDLTKDIQNYLSNHPVSAGPPKRSYIWGKFIRRNRASVALSIIALVAIVSFTLITSIQRDLARKERSRAIQEAQTAQQVLDFFGETFHDLDPYQGGGRWVTAQDILDKAALRARDDRHPKPEVKARFMTIIGGIYGAYGSMEAGRTLLEDALSIIEDNQLDPSIQIKTMIAITRLNLRDSRIEEAEVWAQKLLKAIDEDESHTRDPGEALLLLGQVMKERNEFDRAKNYLQQALEIFQQSDEPFLAANALQQLGMVGYYQGELDEAAQWIEQGFSFTENAPAAHHAIILDLLHAKAMIAEHRGDFEAAIAIYNEVISRDQALFGERYPATATTMTNIGVVLMDHGKMQEAENHINLALEHLDGLVSPDHPLIGSVLTDLGNLKMQSRRYDEAESDLKKALRIISNAYGAEHIKTAGVHQILGLVYASLKDPQAGAHLEKSYEIHHQILGQDHQLVAHAVYTLAFQLWQQGDFEAAASRFEQAVPMMIKSHGTPNTFVASILHHHAGFCLDQGEEERSINLYKQSIAMRRELGEMDHPRLADSLFRLARIYNKRNDFDVAQPLAKEAVTIYEKSLSSDSERIALARDVLQESMSADQ